MPGEDLPRPQQEDELIKQADEHFQAAAQAGEVVEPAEAGEAAVAKHVDVEHVTDDDDPRMANLVHDKDKAEEMAYAGKRDREEAAADRNRAKEIRNLADEAEAIAALRTETNKEWQEKKDRADSFYRRVNEVASHSDYMSAQGTGWDLLKIQEGKGDGEPYRNITYRDKVQQESNYLENESAAEADRRAEKLEEWAAILYDKPISEEYKETHPGVEFYPRTLQRMEEVAGEDEKALQKLEDLLANLPPTAGVNGVDAYVEIHSMNSAVNHFGPRGVMEKAYGHSYLGEGISKWEQTDDANAWREWDELLKNPETTLGQLRDIFAKALEEAYVKPVRSYVASARSVIEDVRSGRASEK